MRDCALSKLLKHGKHHGLITPPPTNATLQVSRARYMPVKSTSDLFLIQSNLYSMSRGMLLLNPARWVRGLGWAGLDWTGSTYVTGWLAG